MCVCVCVVVCVQLRWRSGSVCFVLETECMYDDVQNGDV